MAGRVLRKIGIELGGEVRPVVPEEPGFHMEAALPGMHAEDAGRRCLALGKLPERIRDRADACIRREKPLYVIP